MAEDNCADCGHPKGQHVVEALDTDPHGSKTPGCGGSPTCTCKVFRPKPSEKSN